MRMMRSLNTAILVISALGLATRAKADVLVLGLDETIQIDSLGAGSTLTQDVQVSSTTTIDGLAFFLSDSTGKALTYSITDVTTGTLVLSDTFTNTAFTSTVTPGSISESIPTGSKDWLELYTAPITLGAGSDLNDIYAFSVSGVGALKVGIDPTSFTEVGFSPTGDGTEVGLRVWDPPTAVTPEPSSLLMLGTGILSAAGVLRRRLAR
jgi:hypothetical protein